MKIYLASRYSRRDEMTVRAFELYGLGHQVTSRWINGDHQISDEGLSAEAKAEERTRFAMEDWEDLTAADMCISFTEAPRGTNSRGGRHVEFGGALAAGKTCVIVGHRENVFHCLPNVKFFENWEDCFAWLKSESQALHINALISTMEVVKSDLVRLYMSSEVTGEKLDRIFKRIDKTIEMVKGCSK